MPILQPRDVPLGGIRAMNVRRTLPHRSRTTVGPWVFIDHYGPDDSVMDVAPHPHCGLSTVSWLFTGEIRHNDSADYHETIHPGDLVMMTAGHGISHTEESTSDLLHGAQLWLVHPKDQRDGQQRLQRFTPKPQRIGIAEVLLFMGSLADVEPSTIDAPLDAMGAEITVPAGRSVTIPVRADMEHAVLNDGETIRVNDDELENSSLWYQDPGLSHITIHAPATDDAHLLLLGGLPFNEDIVMFWNFIGTDHEEVAQMRHDWEDPEARAERFGAIHGYRGKTPRIPAPAIPQVRMRPRGNHGVASR